MNITLTAITGSTYSSAFSDPLTIDNSCSTTEAPPTVFTSAAVHRLLQTAGFRFHHLHGFQPLKFRFRCEEVESFTLHNWVNLNIHQLDFPCKLAQTISLLRVRSCFLLQRNLNAQIQSVGQVTKYCGTDKHTQIWKCLRDKALGPICFVCSAKVA